MEMWKKMMIFAALLFLGIALIPFGCSEEDDSDDDDTTDSDDDSTDDDNDVTDDDTTDDDDDDEFDPSILIGKAYFFNIPLNAWTEPVGIGDIIGSFVPIILFGVDDAGEGFIDFIATIGVDTEAKEIIQDECVVTTMLPSGTLDEDWNFETGPHDFEMKIFGLNATLYQTNCSGTIQSDGSKFENVEFGGLVDIRQVIEFFFFRIKEHTCFINL